MEVQMDEIRMGHDTSSKPYLRTGLHLAASGGLDDADHNKDSTDTGIIRLFHICVIFF
jgi:hypothetical protein